MHAGGAEAGAHMNFDKVPRMAVSMGRSLEGFRRKGEGGVMLSWWQAGAPLCRGAPRQRVVVRLWVGGTAR